MNEMVISDYLQNICNSLKNDLPDDIYSCDIYSGQLEENAEDYLNFQVNKKAQCFIGVDEAVFNQGKTLLGDATFVMFIVTISDRKTSGFSTAGMNITQKVSGFINNSDCFNEGTAGRPTLESISQIVNTNKEKKLYNIFRIVYNQKIILKQNFN